MIAARRSSAGSGAARNRRAVVSTGASVVAVRGIPTSYLSENSLTSLDLHRLLGIRCV